MSVEASRCLRVKRRTSRSVRPPTSLTNVLGVVIDTASDPNCLPPLLVGAASAGAIGGLLPAAATSLAFLS